MTPMSDPGPVVVVMARSSLGARAPKSRLVGVLPNEADRRRLAAAFLEDVLATCRTVDRAHLRVAHTVDGGTDGFEAVGATPDELLPQRGDSLGDRERGVFEDLFGSGFSPVVMIGADLPTLPATQIRTAIDQLQTNQNQVVLGPSEDGGYHLIGLARSTPRTAVPDLFSDIRWSTEWTYGDTVAAAERCGLDVTRLPTWYDVDDATGLARLRADLATESGRRQAPATTRVLEAVSIPRQSRGL
jgi:rSAM/selenodomain-associated transferase 1